MSFDKLLVQRCTITRPSITQSALGEQIVDFVVVGTNVPCEIQNLSGAQSRREIGEFLDGQYIGFFKKNQDIKEKDKVVDDRGIEYEVRFIDAPRDGSASPKGLLGHHIEARLVRPHLLVGA